MTTKKFVQYTILMVAILFTGSTGISLLVEQPVSIALSFLWGMPVGLAYAYGALLPYLDRNSRRY